MAPSQSPPRHGLLANEEVEGALEKGDILVAVRGYAVDTQDQYVLLRDLEAFKPFHLVLYRRGRYLESGPYPAHHRFGNLTDYRP